MYVHIYVEKQICLLLFLVISVGFLRQLIEGFESRESSHFEVSWNVSGAAPKYTDYYILPVMYKEKSDADDGNLTSNFLQILERIDYDLPPAAVEGIIGSKKIEICSNKFLTSLLCSW